MKPGGESAVKSLGSFTVDALEIQKELRKMTTEAVDQSGRYADELVKVMIDKVREELESFVEIKPKTLFVKYEENDTIEFDTPVSPYLNEVLDIFKSGENPLLVGPAGSGKSVVCEQAARSLDLPYSHVNCTAGASETWFFGRQTPTGPYKGPLHIRYENGGLFCAEEWDASDENLTLAFNTLLESDKFFNPILNEVVDRHENFLFIATANTSGRGADAVYTGRNRQDGSARSRFVPVKIDYSKEIETAVCPDKELRNKFWNAREELNKRKSEEIWSTRQLRQAFKLKSLGWDEKKIFQSLTFGWPSGLAQNCGLA
jgi:MoxR-like ATPase